MSGEIHNFVYTKNEYCEYCLSYHYNVIHYTIFLCNHVAIDFCMYNDWKQCATCKEVVKEHKRIAKLPPKIISKSSGSIVEIYNKKND